MTELEYIKINQTSTATMTITSLNEKWKKHASHNRILLLHIKSQFTKYPVETAFPSTGNLSKCVLQQHVTPGPDCSEIKYTESRVMKEVKGGDRWENYSLPTSSLPKHERQAWWGKREDRNIMFCLEYCTRAPQVNSPLIIPTEKYVQLYSNLSREKVRAREDDG